MTAADPCRDDDVRIARLVMADGPKTDAEYALARRVLDDAARAAMELERIRDTNPRWRVSAEMAGLSAAARILRGGAL